MTLPTDSEKEIGAIILNGESFSPVTNSKRVRVRVLTMPESLVDFDVNLTSAPQAIVFLSSPTCNVK
jgi:hypothetical protein